MKRLKLKDLVSTPATVYLQFNIYLHHFNRIIFTPKLFLFPVLSSTANQHQQPQQPSKLVISQISGHLQKILWHKLV